MADIHVLISFIIYLFIMMGVGWYFYYRTRTPSDYILAGRGLNSWVTALSAQASDMSGWLLMGLPGVAYLSGMEASWIALGLAVGTFLNWKFIARELRIDTIKMNDSITLPQYFENKFNDKSHLLRMVSSLFILVFFLIYTSSGFVAGAKLFSAVFDINYHMALIISVVVIITYTFLGGFSAVSWTDFIQGILMFLAVVIVPVTGIIISGGISVSVANLKSLLPGAFNPFTDYLGKPLGWITIVSSLAWGLGYFGQPHILARFMAIKNAGKIKFSSRIAMTWVIVSLTAAILIGMVGRQYFTYTLQDAEKVFIELIASYIPPMVSGIFLSTILAAIMSTADSQLLVTSSSLTEDLFQFLSRKKIGDTMKLGLSRVGVILVAILALTIAWNPNSMVLDLVAYAWAGFGASFGPAIILSLYWQKANKQGILSGMIAGGITVLVWKQTGGGIFNLYEIIPGFLVSLLVSLIVSQLYHKKEW